jgi:hypothetical protein
MATILRVINQQLTSASILIDKIDRSQGNFTGYAQKQKMAIYVPLKNPKDLSVKGYSDLPLTDEVLLSDNNGSISGLRASGHITSASVNTTSLVAPTTTSAANALGTTTINGTTFVSIAPDLTYVVLTNTTGVTQVIPASSFASITATKIEILDGVVSIGTPTTGWEVVVKANSKTSNSSTI